MNPMPDTQSSAGSVGPGVAARRRLVPWILMLAGGLGSGIAAAADLRQFAFSWLLAFMFFLSLVLGALFMVLTHHLFDASWSVPIRRLLEHLACLSFPAMAVLFLPVGLLAPKIYPQGGVTMPAFWITALFCFSVWAILSRRLRHWSLEQDATGAAECTFKMRRCSAVGVVFFAVTLTLASVVWMEAASREWRSTIYGVWYFAASLWVTFPTVYLLAAFLKRGPLSAVLRDEQFYFLGTLSLAFTIFYAYIAYSQYFIIWNGNLPAETFWYAARQQGGWKGLGALLLIGHFFVPFLLLLRIDWKLKLRVMLPLCLWAWLMHFCDLQFQIIPVLHPDGPRGLGVDVACFLFFAGVLAETARRYFNAHPPYPQRDPRLAESLGIHLPPTTDIATAPQRAK